MSGLEAPNSLKRASNDTVRVYAAAFILSCLFVLLLPSWLRWCFFYGSGVVFLTSVLGPFVEDWKPKSRVPVAGKAVFISGCDSGFGHQLAQRLDDLGLHVFAGCLFPDGDGAKSLKKSGSNKLHVVPLNVTSDESVEKAKKYVTEKIKDNKLWAVVNNAGISDGGEVPWTNLDIFQRVMDINTFGVVRVTKAFLPMLCKARGRVVTVASAAGRYSYAGMVPYCMSKHAAISFSDGLRLELYRFGVKVVTIEPWMYKTQITNKDAIQKSVEKTWNQASEEDKALFPENYLSVFAKAVNKVLNFSISDKPQEVVDCMEDAILNTSPKYAYNPGTVFSRFMYWVQVRLPKPIVDYGLIKEFQPRDNQVASKIEKKSI